MDEEGRFALVPRPPSAVEKTEPGAKRILSGMVTDTLAFAANGYLPALVRQMCGGKEWDDREQAYLQLRTIGPAFRGWAESLRDVIYSGDGHARIWAAESLSRFKCNPHDAVPVLIAVITASAATDATPTQYGWGRLACGALTNYPVLPEEYSEELVAALVGVLQTTQFRDFSAIPVHQYQFRGLALKILGILGNKAIAALPVLAPLLEDQGAVPVGDPLLDTYRETAKSINASIESPVDALKVALRFGDASTRRNAAAALQEIAPNHGAIGPVDLHALVAEAKRLYDGKGMSDGNIRALKLFRQAAEAGHAEAQYWVGLCFDSGQGVPQDYAEAANWYRKAAELGYAEAQSNLGRCYNDGKGVPQDYAESVRWIRKAAEKGIVNAQANLGYALFNGRGAVRDVNEAVHWYQLAADAGNALAIHNLAVCYSEGQGVAQDHSEAAKLFQVVAEQGYPTSQYNLGLAYLYGRGVTKNSVEAYKWFRLAAEQGHKGAAEEVVSTGALLLPEQFQEGERRLAEFKAAH